MDQINLMPRELFGGIWGLNLGYEMVPVIAKRKIEKRKYFHADRQLAILGIGNFRGEEVIILENNFMQRYLELSKKKAI